MMTQEGSHELLAEGLRFHQAGDLARAEDLYERVLAADPSRAEAWYLLGRIDLSLGKLGAAETRLRRAVELGPGFSETHAHLGIALQGQGRLEEAAACYQQALRLNPRSPEVYVNLGNTLKWLGRLDEALICYQQAIGLDAAFAEAYSNLGIALGEQGRFEEAVACHQHALHLRPDSAEMHGNLGIALAGQGRLEDAEACHRQAIALGPGAPGALGNLANVLAAQGKLEEAVDCYEEALRLKPDFAEAHTNLGNALAAQDRWEEAVAHHEQALHLQPDFAEAHGNLGIVFADQGKLKEAVACYEEALRLKPGDADVHFHRALAWLLMGDFSRGWPEYEWRRQALKIAPPQADAPQWDGAPLAGRTILLYAEQGLGDTLQFVRYAPLVRERGGTVMLACQKPLVPLLSRCRGIDRCVALGDALPPCDVQAPLLSLPLIFGTTESTIPSDMPYLVPDPRLLEHWHRELEAFPGFKVGIAWQGSSLYRHDRRRSIPLAEFAPLAEVPGVTLLSLQKQPDREALRSFSETSPVIDLADRLDETSGAFMDTAAVMQSLDLVIAPDTAIAHLAGGLGVPVWVALPSVPDWRWLLDRPDSPWYPSARLFRQAKPRDWSGVFQDMADAVRRHIDASS